MAPFPTERLYLDDSLKLEFQAEVLEITHFNARPAILLNRSAFYPEGGGQPGDHGLLEFDPYQLKVVDVQVDDAGKVFHLLEESPNELATGQRLRGKVDSVRRRDYLSQHTGQHMLSGIVDQLMDAATISARLGSKTATIDVAGDVTQFTPTQLADLETKLNALVLEDRPVHTRYPKPAALAEMSLRRRPKVQKDIRIIEIQDFDYTPCGGTHCHRTGQVGPIKIIGKERYKGLTRLTFLAGQRAIDHLTLQDQILKQVCTQFGCAPEDLHQQFIHLREELKQQSQQLGNLRAQVLDREVQEILRNLPKSMAKPLVIIRNNEDLRTSRQFATALGNHPQILALVATREKAHSDWRLILIRGLAAVFDCGAWFRGPGKAAGARGGGRPNRAEGSLPQHCDPHSLTF